MAKKQRTTAYTWLLSNNRICLFTEPDLTSLLERGKPEPNAVPILVQLVPLNTAVVPEFEPEAELVEV